MPNANSQCTKISDKQQAQNKCHTFPKMSKNHNALKNYSNQCEPQQPLPPPQAHVGISWGIATYLLFYW